MKEPLLQFLLLGACVYLAYGLFGTPDEDSEAQTIHVDAEQIDAFIVSWQSRWKRPPTQAELDGLIQRYVQEELLYRQAVTMGLDENDPITRRRLAQKVEFLTRNLSQMKGPGEGELEEYFQENRANYRDPDLIRFVQVFFNPDKRDNATLDDAAKALAQLQAEGEPDPATLTVGDQTILQSLFEDVDEFEVSRTMGSGFAESVMKMEAGKWHGPVLSGYGVHLVYVFSIQEAAPPKLADVKTRVLEDWHEEQAENFRTEFLKNLRENYEIVIDPLPVDRLIVPPAVPENESAKDDANGGKGESL